MGAVDDVLVTLRRELEHEKVLITISLARQEAIHTAIESLEALGDSGPPVKLREPVAKRPPGAPPKRAIARQSPKPKPTRGGSGVRKAPTPTSEDVARVLAGVEPAEAVRTIAEAFGVSRQAAGQFVRRARERGALDETHPTAPARGVFTPEMADKAIAAAG